MNLWKRGDFVLLNERLAVVVGVEGDSNCPDEHLALWFGDPQSLTPEVWAVPAEYCEPASPANINH